MDGVDYLWIYPEIVKEDITNVEVGWKFKLNVTIFPPNKNIEPYSKYVEIEETAYKGNHINYSEKNMITLDKLKGYEVQNKIFFEIDMRVGDPFIVPGGLSK